MIEHLKKILSIDKLVEEISLIKKQKKKIAFTNGCFDIIHIGHINILKEAKELSDIVIVGLNSDSSVKKNKGNKRPIISENERAEVLSSIQYVDYVTIFSDLTPLNLIKKVQPDFLIKGGDWNKKDIVGSDIVESKGGKVIKGIFIDSKSTSDIIENIKNMYGR